MNWNDLKVGGKLGIGFGLLILISVILGGLAVFNMSNVSSESRTLANEYVPEVRVSNEIERNAREVMYNMRGYGLTAQENYLQEARSALSRLDGKLNEARRLDQQAKQLDKLAGNINSVENNLSEYKTLVEQTVTENQEIAQAGDDMDMAADNFMKACYNYLESQHQQMESEVQGGTGQGAIIERHDKITLINNIIDAGNILRVANFKAQARSNPDGLRTAVDKFDISQYISQLQEITTLNRDKRALNTIEESAQNYINAVQDYLTAWQDRNSLNQERDQVATNVLNATQEVADAGVNETSEIANNSVSLLSRSSTIMITGLLIALVLGIVLAMAITRAITRPLNKGVNFAREIANGNLEATVNVNQKDEIGMLADALRNMAQKLKDIVLQIKEGANNIASASQQVSSSSQQMSQGSNEQASAAEEVSSSMEEMTSNIQQNNDNAKETEKIASKATDSIKEGNKASQNSMVSMQEIAEKISIINDIAFQTNILALNAAVEAARAGEHGKGFAVVAAEVRKLAERSGEAAKEIDEKSKSGVDISKQAGEQLQGIVPEIEKTSNLVREISASSNEMNSGASQINSSVQQLSQVTQQNASSSEELASNAEELSSQADQLRDLVSFFKVNENRQTSFSKKQTNFQTNTKQNTNKQNKDQNQKQSKAPQKGQGAALNLNDSSQKSDEGYEPY